MSFAEQAAKAAGIALARLGGPAKFKRRDSITKTDVVALLNRSVARVSAEGEPYLQAEVTMLVSVGTVARGDLITTYPTEADRAAGTNGEVWSVDAPSKNNGHTAAFFVIPDRP